MIFSLASFSLLAKENETKEKALSQGISLLPVRNRSQISKLAPRFRKFLTRFILYAGEGENTRFDFIVLKF